ncbi:MAG: toll/interleukin-1 receptor domain-containing protein [Verrucomicrobiota bacterium]
MSDKPTAKAPLVFISYSHDSKPHKEWVAGFALRLREKGVEVLFDQFDIGPGDDVPKFMERAVSEADHVLMVCTETYVRKADDGKGGVGYEAMVVTGELIRDLGTSKFIPVIRQSGPDKPVPRCVSTRFYVDLSEGADIEEEFEKLLRKIHQVPKLKKPPLGANPFAEETFESAASLAKKQDRRLEFSEALASPDTAYERALDIIHAKDRVAWRRLLLAAEEYSATSLCQWRADNPHIPGLDEKDPSVFFDYTRRGVECFGPFIACIVAAAESGDEDYAGQLGWVDSILSPSKWQRTEYTYWVDFPETIFFVAQAVVGAMLMESGLGKFAHDLALTKLPERWGAPQTESLFKQTRLTGWPDALGHHCTVAWRFLNSVIDNWGWLQKAFGNTNKCREGVTAYYLLLTVLNFSWRVTSPGDGPYDASVTVPLGCLAWPNEQVRRGYQLLLRHKPLLCRILDANKLDPATMTAQWKEWMTETGQWMRSVYPNHWGWSLPHKTLPDDLTRNPNMVD